MVHTPGERREDLLLRLRSIAQVQSLLNMKATQNYCLQLHTSKNPSPVLNRWEYNPRPTMMPVPSLTPLIRDMSLCSGGNAYHRLRFSGCSKVHHTDSGQQLCTEAREVRRHIWLGHWQEEWDHHSSQLQGRNKTEQISSKGHPHPTIRLFCMMGNHSAPLTPVLSSVLTSSVPSACSHPSSSAFSSLGDVVDLEPEGSVPVCSASPNTEAGHLRTQLRWELLHSPLS